MVKVEDFQVSEWESVSLGGEEKERFIKLAHEKSTVKSDMT